MSQEDQGHQSLINTPKQLVTVIVLAFVIVIVGIWLLVGYVTEEPLTDAKYSDALSKDAIASRIAPVAHVELAPATTPEPQAAAPAPAAPAAPVAPPDIVKAVAAANASAAQAGNSSADPGQKLFGTVCIACHGSGVQGAPKFGDKSAWAPRIAEGMETLYTHALRGFQGKNGVMPPKGGSSAADDDVKAAVRYMVQAAK